MDLKICSLNVRGLGDKLKRREMFNWLRRKSYPVYRLQEVHCSENKIPVWSAEWGYKTLFSCCTSKKEESRFFSIITSIFKSYGHTWIPTADSSSAILQQIKKCMTIATLYAPNDDDQISFWIFLLI